MVERNKTAQLHIKIEEEQIRKLKEEAEQLGISLTELCRNKLSNRFYRDETDYYFVKFLELFKQKGKIKK